MPPGTQAPSDTTDAIHPADTDTAALDAAERRMATQDWDGALALLNPLLQHQPGNARALYDTAFCQDARNDIDAAKTMYARALQADPKNVSAAVSLGLLLGRHHEDAAAIAALTQAIALSGSGGATENAAKAQAWRALARLQLSGSPESSRDDLLQALRLSSETPDDVQLAGEIAEALHDDSSAETAYARVLLATPTDAGAAAQSARVLLRQGKTAAADAVIEPALAAHPADAQLISEKAGVLLQEKKVAQALPLLEQLHTEQPDNVAVTQLLARAEVAQGDYATAEPLFRELAAAAPTSGDVLAEWADCLIRQKRNAEAQPILERALAATFTSPSAKARAASELAFAASSNHQPQVVLRAISIRNAIEPLDASSAFLLATAHDSLHQSREAAGAYRQFIALANGKFPDEVWQATQRLQTLSRAK